MAPREAITPELDDRPDETVIGRLSAFIFPSHDADTPDSTPSLGDAHLVIDALLAEPDSIDTPQQIALQKYLHDTVAAWHESGEISDEAYNQSAVAIFTDLQGFSAQIQSHAMKTEPDGPDKVRFIDLTDDSQHEIGPLSGLQEPLRDYLLKQTGRGFRVSQLHKLRLLSPLSFVDVLNEIRDTDFSDKRNPVVKIVGRFVRAAQAEFIEPRTPESEMTSVAELVERQISEFIDSGENAPNLHLLDATGLYQISEIYNPNNLLALAKELSAPGEQKRSGLNKPEIIMLLRYHTVLRAIDVQHDVIILRSNTGLERDIRVGARTWAGYLHPYGCLESGFIDPDEWKAFSGEPEEAETESARSIARGRGAVFVDGVRVVLNQIVGRIPDKD